MTDKDATIAELATLVREFSRARDWEQFHFPKDLGVALAIETGEVLEHFRFRTNDEIERLTKDPAAREALGHELADVLWALLRLAEVCGVDLSAALSEKVRLADEKYPAEKVRGLPHKYTFYQNKD
jgi:dCTP diphosphatase